MRIALIGLGLLGKALARRLIARGYQVVGYDINPAACEAAADDGVELLESAGAAGDAASLLIFSLMTSDDRRRLLWGEQRLAGHLKAGTLLLDTTTAAPNDVREDNARLENDGIRLVDVCISGSSQVVDEGRALALVGDSPERAAGYAEVLAAFSARQFYFHGPGRGNEAKLVVNTVLGLNRLVLAEGLALARAGGFDLAAMLEVLKAGETYSKVMDAKGRKMISQVYEPAVARLSQHAKDVRLILEYAKDLGVDMPVSRVHQELIETAENLGAGDLDNAAIFEAYIR